MKLASAFVVVACILLDAVTAAPAFQAEKRFEASSDMKIRESALEKRGFLGAAYEVPYLESDDLEKRGFLGAAYEVPYLEADDIDKRAPGANDPAVGSPLVRRSIGNAYTASWAEVEDGDSAE